MSSDKGSDFLGGGEGQPPAVTDAPYELAVIDGKAAEGGFGHPNGGIGEKSVDFLKKISFGHAPEDDGLLPTCQWAIAQVTADPLVGNVPPMDSGWRTLLRAEMTKKGFNMKSLSKKAGLGDTYVRDLLVRDREPSLAKAQKICAVLEIPLAKVFGTWDGPLDDADDDDQLPAPSVDGFVPIGRFDASFSMGPGSLIADEPAPLGYWVFEEQWLRALSAVSPDRLAVVKVNGDSMTPTLFGGDLVLIDRSKTRPNFEGIYAIKVGDIAWVKRISVNLKSQKVRVLSDNPLVPKQPEMNEDELSIIGRVIALVARKVP